MSSVHKEVAPQFKLWADDKKICLGLSAAYSSIEALEGAKIGIKGMGIDPADFEIGFQTIFIPAKSIIAMPAPAEFNAPMTVEPVKSELVDPRKKEKEALVAYVRYVFDQVGSKQEKQMAEEVINKFLSKKK